VPSPHRPGSWTARRPATTFSTDRCSPGRSGCSARPRPSSPWPRS
jgi:hypothetical protein